MEKHAGKVYSFAACHKNLHTKKVFAYSIFG